MVDGSSSIAKKYGISKLVIGLTIVAFGTSLPELVVNIMASLGGSADIALGSIIGSNISNTLLVLGITALVAPLIVTKSMVNKEIPFSLLVIILFGVLVNDSFFNGFGPDGLLRIDGIVLLLFFTIFIYFTFGLTKIKKGGVFKIDEGGKIKEHGNTRAVLMIILGLSALFVGGEWIVNGAIEISKSFGLSESLIGLTIVALGTSLPELAASVVAAKKGFTDMAVGTIIGSNIFNFLWIFGLSAVINPIAYNPALNFDISFLLYVTILLLFLIYIGKRNVLSKTEGVVLISLYVAYIGILVSKG